MVLNNLLQFYAILSLVVPKFIFNQPTRARDDDTFFAYCHWQGSTFPEFHRLYKSQDSIYHASFFFNVDGFNNTLTLDPDLIGGCFLLCLAFSAMFINTVNMFLSCRASSGVNSVVLCCVLLYFLNTCSNSKVHLSVSSLLASKRVYICCLIVLLNASTKCAWLFVNMCLIFYC